LSIPHRIFCGFIHEKDYLETAVEVVDNVRMSDKGVILVVAEKLLEAEAITEKLEKLGYDFLTAGGLQETLSIAAEQDPDVVIIDCPDECGIDSELVRLLKENDKTAAIPVVFSAPSDDAFEAALEAGVSGILVKPLRDAELLTNLRSLIRLKRLRDELEALKNVQPRKSTVSVFFDRRRGQDVLLCRCGREKTGEVKEALESAGFEVVAEKRRRQELIDSLTGLYSELYVENIIEKEMAAARRYNKVFSVLLIDVDNFSRFNKRFGRESGDMAIREIASIFLKSIRNSDIAARLDEEKFCLMLPLTKASESMLLAERLRRKVEACELDGDKDKRLTISIGITEFRNEDVGAKAILARGMEGAHRVKEKGKNSSVII